MDKPEVLRLADAIDPLTRRNLDNLTCAVAAAELRRLARVEAQRDALLEALKAAEPYLRHADVDYNVYVQCCAAIALVEGRVKMVEETK